METEAAVDHQMNSCGGITNGGVAGGKEEVGTAGPQRESQGTLKRMRVIKQGSRGSAKKSRRIE